MINSLSIIIPFYNEEKRISTCLTELDKFHKKNKKKIEVIFVDDGSHDNSKYIIMKNYKKKKNKNFFFRLITYKKNRGKGFALKKGVLNAKFDWLLTTDVDFSVSLNQLNIWKKKNFLRKKKYIYFGSRQHMQSKVKTKILRKFLGVIFRYIIDYILNIKIKDTQCGFKLYKKNIAKKIFSSLSINGFEHDLEIVLLAKEKNFEIVELPVTWKHKEGSKINIYYDTIKMFFGVLILKLKFLR